MGMCWNSPACESVCIDEATGDASARGIDTEDAITLLVSWENLESRNQGTGVYTSS